MVDFERKLAKILYERNKFENISDEVSNLCERNKEKKINNRLFQYFCSKHRIINIKELCDSMTTFEDPITNTEESEFQTIQTMNHHYYQQKKTGRKKNNSDQIV